MAIGCGWALQSAEWLAASVAGALAGEEPLSRALRRYGQVHRRRLGGHHRMLTAEARAHRINPVQRLLFSGAARDPQLAALLHRYAERSLSPRHLLAPSALARAVWVNATFRPSPEVAATA